MSDNTRRPDWLTVVTALIYQLTSGPRTLSEDRNSEALVRASRRTATATWVMAAATLAILGLGIFQFLTVRSQLQVMQRQLDDSEIQEAASITFRHVTVSGFPSNTVVEFDVVNAGKTRADKVTVDPGYHWMPAASLQGFLLNEHALGGRVQANAFGYSLEAGEQRHFQEPIKTVQAFDDFPKDSKIKLPSWDDVISGRFASVISLWGSYADVFGKTHHEAVCMFYVGTGFQSCFASSRHYQ